MFSGLRPFSYGLVAAASCLLAACGPASPTARPGGEPGTASAQRATITVAALNSVKGFSPWLIGTTGGGARSLFEIHTNGLVSNDAHGNLEGRLAARLPSLDDGTIAILPDGRMQATWKLRPNIKWHDGAPFSAEDLVFGWQVNTHPEIPTPSTPSLHQMDKVEALDPHTAVITWKTTFFRSLRLGFVDLWPFPRHLLAEAFAGEKEMFLNLPYWTTEYIHLGAFRLVDFGLGENLILERFDDYFLGRPKVDRIVIRIIPDENTLFANLQAGTVDIATESTLDAELMVQLREDWRRTGGGIVVHREGNWRFINIQHNPDYGRPPELRQDVRIRRGLLAAVDRNAIRGATVPGFPDTDADTFMPRSDPRAPLVGKPFGGFRYDPALALQQLAEGGWRRGPDGRMLNQAGEPVQINLRTTAGNDKEQAIVAQYWRELGLDIVQEVIPGSLISDRAYRATFPGMEITAQGNGDSVLARFDGRQCPRPPRFAGAQGGCYMNPALDRLIDRLYGTIDEREQGMLLREMGELMAADLPALPLRFTVQLAAVRHPVRALADDFPGTSPGLTSRYAHLWERQ